MTTASLVASQPSLTATLPARLPHRVPRRESLPPVGSRVPGRAHRRNVRRPPRPATALPTPLSSSMRMTRPDHLKTAPTLVPLAHPTTVFLWDLDHTLIHSMTPKEVEDHDMEAADLTSFMVHLCGDVSLRIFVRPGALEMLRFFADEAPPSVRMGVWTAATEDYAQAVVDGLLHVAGVPHLRPRLATIRSRASTTRISDGATGTDVLVKDVHAMARRMCLPAHRVFLIDDNHVHSLVPRNEGRVLFVPPFEAHEHVARDAPSGGCADADEGALHPHVMTLMLGLIRRHAARTAS